MTSSANRGRAEQLEEGPLWVPCEGGCGEFWCRRHDMHAYDCPCPSIDELDFDPYETGGPPLDGPEPAA